MIGELFKNISRITGRLRVLFRVKSRRRSILLGLASILFCAAAYGLIAHDQALYAQPLARVVSAAETADSDSGYQAEQTQQIRAVLLNGRHRGETIGLQNTYTASAAASRRLKTGDEIFVTLTEQGGRVAQAQFLDMKRDRYLAYMVLLFLLLLLFVGGKRGLRSLAGMTANLAVMAAILRLYLAGLNLVALSGAAAVAFIGISIPLIGGWNKKAQASMAASAAGMAVTAALAAAVFAAAKGGGVHYDQMEFLMRSPQEVFMAELLIGTLGGIMDIAVTMASAVGELCEKSPGITRRALRDAGMTIGRDMMGTMVNTIFFAYLCGGIPMILLRLMNGYSMVNIWSIHMSLELIRFLTGGIGVAVSIPLSLYLSIAWFRPKTNEGLKT